MYLLVYSFFVKVVFVLRFDLNFLKESRKGKQSQLTARGVFRLPLKVIPIFHTDFPLL